MLKRVITLAALLLVSWVVMTFTHEAGHLLGGWVSGATLVEANLAPWQLPYSLHQPDPHPLVTLWSGPVAGVAIPILFAGLIRHPNAWFVADFCMLANGCYLAAAWLTGEPQTDTQRLLAAGANPAILALFCLMTIPIGYFRFRTDCMRVLSRRNSDVPAPD